MFPLQDRSWREAQKWCRCDWNSEDKSLDTSSPSRPGVATRSQDAKRDPTGEELRRGFFGCGLHQAEAHVIGMSPESVTSRVLT